MILGIDPGLTGAMAALDAHGVAVGVWPLPAMAVDAKGSRRELDPGAFRDLLSREVGAGGVTAYVERLSAYPGNGVQAAFSQGDTQGVIRSVLALLEIPVHRVRANVWKRAVGLSPGLSGQAAKEAARAMAIRLFPSQDLHKKADHNKADALLLAYYGWQHEGGSHERTHDDTPL